MNVHAPCLPRLPRGERYETDSAPNFVRRLLRFPGGVLDQMAERRRIRQKTAELLALSDATLKDIGVDRAEIEYLALQCQAARRSDCGSKHGRMY